MTAGALRCRFCDAPVTHTLVDLGEMPLANAYLCAEDLGRDEPRYPLHARVCGRCFLVQIEAVVDPSELFGDYAYFSSYSDSWLEHAHRFATRVIQDLSLGGDSLVLEIASNDGYLLRRFVDAGVPVLGIEPAGNVAAAARAAGVPTEERFFGRDFAANLLDRGGAADLVVANNVLAHVPDLNDFVAGMAMVLKVGGVISIEVPHLLRLIECVEFDTVYHEHFSYFSLLTAERVLAAHSLSVFDVEELPTHGGSLRIWAAHADRARPVSVSVLAVRAAERAAGLEDLETYSGFEGKVKRCRRSVTDFLAAAKDEGTTVACYGAAAKGNTLLNYCGISTRDVVFVADRSPHKQGRYLPGTHLPISAPERVGEEKPGYLIILPWNLKDEIMAQMSYIRDWGGRFVTPIPQVEVHP